MSLHDHKVSYFIGFIIAITIWQITYDLKLHGIILLDHIDKWIQSLFSDRFWSEGIFFGVCLDKDRVMVLI